MVDFDGAIRAHSDWKMKLSKYLKHPDGSLKPADIQPDNRCELGQWIHGQGASHGNLPEYGKLKTVHADFHRAAADVVRRADSGESVGEEVALGAKSAYGQASSGVVAAIISLRGKI